MSSDEEFREIFKNNNLDDLFGNTGSAVSMTVKDLQEGLTEICSLSSCISSFLVEYYQAYENESGDDAPRLTLDAVKYLMEIFEKTELFLNEVDVDSDEEDNDE